MRVSDLMTELERVRATYGDVPVVIATGEAEYVGWSVHVEDDATGAAAVLLDLTGGDCRDLAEERAG